MRRPRVRPDLTDNLSAELASTPDPGLLNCAQSLVRVRWLPALHREHRRRLLASSCPQKSCSAITRSTAGFEPNELVSSSLRALEGAWSKMASPTLNFITFNQDHSCLAVGKRPVTYAVSASISLTLHRPQAPRKAFASTIQTPSLGYSPAMTEILPS